MLALDWRGALGVTAVFVKGPPHSTLTEATWYKCGLYGSIVAAKQETAVDQFLDTLKQQCASNAHSTSKPQQGGLQARSAHYATGYLQPVFVIGGRCVPGELMSLCSVSC